MRTVWMIVLATELTGGAVGAAGTRPPAARPATPSRLTAVDAAALRGRLSALRGKVVVVNMWATWCGPCVMEFPELVKLDRTYRGRGVAVVGLSMDEPAQARQVVPPFLTRHRPGFPVLILKPGASQSVVRVLDANWRGAIPMTYIFDRTGRLRTRIEGARTLEGFEMVIRPLLTGG
jgi:thiol-disulfide isomerase/thioredoxin